MAESAEDLQSRTSIYPLGLANGLAQFKVSFLTASANRFHGASHLQFSADIDWVRIIMSLSTGYKLFPFCSWHLNSSTGRSAEQIVLIMRPDAIKQTSVPPPAVAAPPTTPSAPPRRKARKAPKPPPRRHSRISKNPPESYPCHMDPFGTVTCSCDQTDRYKSLRRNLARVLEGLQQPLPSATTLSLSPFSMSKSFDEDPLDLVEDPALSSPRKVKARKWTHGLLKRLSKPFAKNSSVPVETKASELSSSSSGYQSNPSQPFWQRLKSRKNRKSQFYIPSSSSGSETISSNSCLYAAY